MMKLRSLICSLLPILLTTAVVAAQPDAPAGSGNVRVGVVVELTVNVTAERSEALGAALADALHRELEVDAVGGGDVSRRLPERGVPDECVATPGCVADLARRLDVDEILFLAVVQVGPDIHIDSSWVSVATGEVLSRPRVELLADARAGEVFSAAATRLLPHARKRPLATVIVPMGPTGPQRSFTKGVWIAGGVALAAGGGATMLGLSARARYRTCERETDCTRGDRDEIGRRALYADILIGTAVAATATAVVLYMRSAPEERATVTSPPGPTTAVTVSPTRGGAFAELRVGF
jgi:hypothetical protein